jgi:tRNA pseudouridine13 synthase
MEVYATKTEGVGGAIKASVEDFMVEEVLVDGSKAQINPSAPQKSVLGCTQEPQRYLLCVLVKRNWDNFIAVKNVARQLGIDQNRVQIAGIKDAKAATAQYITIENVLMEDAAKVDVTGITVRPVGYVRNPLSLFYLLGNGFTITVSGINQEERFIKEQVEAAMSQISQVGGMPNFFGHQRFGTIRPITHLVGKALLKGNLEEATMIFLAQPSPHEHPESRQARAELEESRDFSLALEQFPKQLRYERSMLHYLTEKPGDFAGAFRTLPPKLQVLFVQAYQSYLFNRFLSERLKAGLPLAEALVGDFVVGIERTGLPLVNMPRHVTEESLAKTNEAVAAGKLRVALPLVGFKQKLSKGVMGEFESQVLAEEGVDLWGFGATVNSKMGGRGGLRTATTPVKSFQLLNATSSSISLGFTLYRGSYATVLLREIMKPSNPIAAGF